MNIHYIRKSIPENNLHLFLSNFKADQHVTIINDREEYISRGEAYDFYSDEDSIYLAVTDSYVMGTTIVINVEQGVTR